MDLNKTIDDIIDYLKFLKDCDKVEIGWNESIESVYTNFDGHAYGQKCFDIYIRYQEPLYEKKDEFSEWKKKGEFNEQKEKW